MSAIVICEKPSQARNIMKAVGSRYGEVLPAQGHLLRLTLPHEENPDWKTWSSELLRPKGGRYRLKPDPAGGKGERFQKIKNALARADTVIIATDCDREGQAIGEHILRYLGFKGTVKRAMFTAEDEKTLAHAFDTAAANENYQNLYEAAIARQQSDQIFNLSLTRAATVQLVPKGVRSVIGIGRVKTPTMAIVCRREAELRNFTPRNYFELVAHMSSPHGSFRLAHRPPAEARIFDRDRADRLVAALGRGWTGPVSVTKERKCQAPGRPMDLPTLQKRAAAWGWTARKTLETAQALYETHKVTTYPRAATRYLPENMSAEAIAAYEGLAKARAAGAGQWEEPAIRRGKAGVFSDAGLDGESHHAIIPNPAVAFEFAARIAALSADERRLFDLIARAFVVCLGPDHVYDRTEIAIAPAVDGKTVKFNAVGKVTIDPGWKALDQAADRDGNDDEAEESQSLPPIADGDRVSIERVVPERKVTTPPPRYTEGSLIDAMQNAWKFVGKPEEKARLNEAKGIGTPATRDTIIDGLKAQNLLTVTKGKLHASEAAMQLYELLQNRCPELVDPGATARMETRLDAVLRREAAADAVIDGICENASRLIDSLVSGQPQTLAIARKPSPKMIEAARFKARRTGVKLAKDVLEDFDKCRAFLGPMPERGDGPKRPSPAQLGLAEKLAARYGILIPEGAQRDAAALSRWIDAHNLATENQLKWVRKLVEDGRAKPPTGYPDRVSAGEAKKILDKAFAGKGSKKNA